MKKLLFIIFTGLIVISARSQTCTSSFTFQNTGTPKSVWFKDLSSPNQSNWHRDYTHWNFSDGSPIDTNKIIFHTFPQTNIYNVVKTTQFSQVGNPSNFCIVKDSSNVDASIYYPGCLPQYKFKVAWLADSTYGVSSYYSGCNYTLKEIALKYGAGITIPPSGPIQATIYSTNHNFFTCTLPTKDSVYTFAQHIILVPTPTLSSAIANTWYISNIPAMPTGCHASFFMMPSDSTLQNWTIQNYSSGSGPLTYSWDFGDATTSNLANPTHTYAALGTYTVCLTVSNGTCSDTYCSTALTDSTQIGYGMKKINTVLMNVGIKKNTLEDQDISIFPSPVENELTISFGKNNYNELHLQVIDMLGKEFINENISKESYLYKQDLSVLNSGVYILQLKDNMQRVVARKKFIKN